jgi:hypothetical protein
VYVVVGSTLASGEDGGVDSGLEVGLLVLSEEDETSSGTSEGLVASENGGGKVDQLFDHSLRRLVRDEDDETYVVVVTTSQYSKGEFWTLPATRPEMWAMSERR